MLPSRFSESVPPVGAPAKNVLRRLNEGSSCPAAVLLLTGTAIEKLLVKPTSPFHGTRCDSVVVFVALPIQNGKLRPFVRGDCASDVFVDQFRAASFFLCRPLAAVTRIGQQIADTIVLVREQGEPLLPFWVNDKNRLTTVLVESFSLF